MSKRQTVLSVILIIPAVVGLILYLFLGSVSAEVKSDSVIVKGTLSSDAEILYSDIEELLLYDSVDKGLPSMTFKNIKVTTGRYSSSQYGPYHLMVYNNVEKYIIIKANDEYVIFNCKTAEETAECYTDIQETMKLLPENQVPEPEPTPEPTPETAPNPTFNIGGESPN